MVLNVVDCFAVNKLIDSESNNLRQIGYILYRCNGTLNKDETETIAKLLSELTDIEEEVYQKGYDKGFDDAEEEYSCECC